MGIIHIFVFSLSLLLLLFLFFFAKASVWEYGTIADDVFDRVGFWSIVNEPVLLLFKMITNVVKDGRFAVDGFVVVALY